MWKENVRGTIRSVFMGNCLKELRKTMINSGYSVSNSREHEHWTVHFVNIILKTLIVAYVFRMQVKALLSYSK
jgi:hypothetical protein